LQFLQLCQDIKRIRCASALASCAQQELLELATGFATHEKRARNREGARRPQVGRNARSSGRSRIVVGGDEQRQRARHHYEHLGYALCGLYYGAYMPGETAIYLARMLT
jgi:hypothetical protein